MKRKLPMKYLIMSFVLLVVSCCAAAAQTQEPTPSLPAVIKGGTEFVQVPIVVQRGGKHLGGLTKDDFTVQQDGRAQSVASFEEIHASASTVAAKAEGTFGNSYAAGMAAPQIVMLAIDTVNTSTLDQSYFREELKKYFAAMKPTDAPLG